jgi:methyl-accepting chemotaxis protein
MASYRMQDHTTATLSSIVARESLRVRLAYEMQGHLLFFTRNVRDILLSQDAATRDRYMAKADKFAASFEAARTELTELLVRKQVGQRMAADWSTYHTAYQNQFLPLLAAGHKTEAQGVALGAMLTTVNGLLNQIRDTIDYNNRRMDQRVHDAIASGNRTLLFLGVIFLIGSAMSVSLALLITRTISRSLDQLVSGVSRVAAGDLTVQMVKTSGDELGTLTDHFGHMTESLRTLVGSISLTANEVAATSQQLSASSEEAARATQSVSQTISQLAAGNAQQAEAITASADDAQTMHHTAADVSASAQQAATASASSATAAGVGQEALEAAVSRVQGLHQAVVSSAHTVRDLGSLSDQIGQIVGMIQGIASQTNLLALNAAIEAARAGEHGRGFAVVAEEVRKLAGESARSAHEITGMIGQIQQETRRAVESMEQGQIEADESVRLIGRAGSSINQIVEAVRTTDSEVGLISIAMSDLASGLQRVASSMEDVSAVAEENAAGAEEVTAAAEEQTASIEEISAAAQNLAKMGETLQQLVKQFRTDRADASTPALALPNASRRQLAHV